MSNPLKKTMVYLGLADEEFEAEPRESPAPAAPAQSGGIDPLGGPPPGLTAPAN